MSKRKPKPKYKGFLKREMKGPMRVIQFYAADKDKYNIIYTGAVNTNKEFVNRGERRVYGSVLTKLESIGVAVDGGFKLLETTATLHSITLEDAEYTALIAALDAVPWRATAIRTIDAAIDWLESFPKT